MLTYVERYRFWDHSTQVLQVQGPIQFSGKSEQLMQLPSSFSTTLFTLLQSSVLNVFQHYPG